MINLHKIFGISKRKYINIKLSFFDRLLEKFGYMRDSLFLEYITEKKAS